MDREYDAFADGLLLAFDFAQSTIAFDSMSHAIKYLAAQFKQNGHRGDMRANLDARQLLLDLNMQILADTEAIMRRMRRP